MPNPILHIAEILEWAKEFHACHGRWPTRKDGPVAGQIDLKWSSIDEALSRGYRGLRPGSSLAKLLLKKFGRRHKGLLPKFTIEGVLAWADAHRQRTGDWPSRSDGKIAGAPGETWSAVEQALLTGMRGFPGGSSLAQLLGEHRDVRNIQRLPRFTQRQILAWADAYHSRTGRWPTKDSGQVAESPQDTWHVIDIALSQGVRGLSRSGTLAQFLSKRRSVRYRRTPLKASIPRILAWADAHFKRTGKWPTHLSGPIPEAPGETWRAVHQALYRGGRGFPGGDSLFKLLKRHGRRRVPNSSI